MATVTAYAPLDMSSSRTWQGVATVANTGYIRLESYPHRQDFYGSFIYSPVALVGGTINSTYGYEFGSLTWSVTGLSLAALTYNAYLAAGDIQGLYAYQLAGGDSFTGSEFADTIRSFAGDDTIRGASGSDNIDGGAGIDTAVFSGARFGYEISRNGAIWTITDTRLEDGNDGSDSLVNVEYARFADMTIELVNHAPYVSRAREQVNASLNAPVAMRLLIEASDPDSWDSIQLYRFWDPVGDGYFTVNGVARASGTYLDVAAADLDAVAYVGSNRITGERLWAQVYDGSAWSDWTSWEQRTTRLDDQPAVARVPDLIVETQAWVRIGDLGIVVTDAEGDAPLIFHIRDGNADTGSARWWYMGYYFAQGRDMMVTIQDVNDFWIQAAQSGGVTDTFYISVFDGTAWGEDSSFRIVTRVPNRAPVVAGSGLVVPLGARVAATNLVAASDADADAITRYRFIDSAGGGEFRLDDQTQPAGPVIEVAAADMARLAYVAGATNGRETLQAQVFDGRAWSAWTSWEQVTLRPRNQAPTASPLNRGITAGGWMRASNLPLGAWDPDGDPIVRYRFMDVDAGANGMRMWFGGTFVTQGGSVEVSAAELSDLWFQGRSGVGSDRFGIAVSDGDMWSSAASFDMLTRLSNRPPVISIYDVGIVVNTSVAAWNRLTIEDPDGDGYRAVQVFDPAGGGHFTFMDQPQPEGAVFEVGDLLGLAYVGGANPGSETARIRAFDGEIWGAWTDWNLRTLRATNTVPVVRPQDKTLETGTWIRASDLPIAVTDADGDAPYRYVFSEASPGAAARMWYQGQFVAGRSITVTAEQLSALWFRASDAPRIDRFVVTVSDGYDWSPSTSEFALISRAANHAPEVRGSGVTVQVGATIAATDLLTVSDGDGDAAVAYRFWDAPGGGGFLLNGVAQASGATFEVSTANVGALTYRGAPSPGRETLWVQVYDGEAWSAWSSWSQQTVRASNTLPTVAAASRNLLAGQWLRASELSLSVSDADGDAPAQVRITDGSAAAGSTQLWMGGGFIAQGGSVTVNAGDLPGLWILGGANAGTDAFTVEVSDGYGWSSPAAFDLVTRVPNRAPVVSGAGFIAALTGSAAATSLISVTDADGDSPTVYRFWDPAGAGAFTLNGVTQASGRTIEVGAADIANLRYESGTIGRETLWAQVYDGQAWSAWASWQQRITYTGVNAAPMFSYFPQPVEMNAWIRLSSLLPGYGDSDHDPMTALRIRDMTTGGARLWYDGAFVDEASTLTVDAGAIDRVWLQTGPEGVDYFRVSASDGLDWSADASFGLTRRTDNLGPTLSNRPADAYAGYGKRVEPLLVPSDPNGVLDHALTFELWDPAGGGRFERGNGDVLASATTLNLSVIELRDVYYRSPEPGTETLWARASDGLDWGPWMSWVQTTIAGTPPHYEGGYEITA